MTELDTLPEHCRGSRAVCKQPRRIQVRGGLPLGPAGTIPEREARDTRLALAGR